MVYVISIQVQEVLSILYSEHIMKIGQDFLVILYVSHCLPHDFLLPLSHALYYPFPIFLKSISFLSPNRSCKQGQRANASVTLGLTYVLL